MITVVRELNRPRYPTVPMRLAAEDVEVATWDNSVLKLDVETIGLKGSPTWVSKIFSPERDQGEIVGDGMNNPEGTANLLVEKLLSKDLLAL
jgi:electron transfer flavoprotein beta subunit